MRSIRINVDVALRINSVRHKIQCSTWEIWQLITVIVAKIMAKITKLAHTHNTLFFFNQYYSVLNCNIIQL